MIRSRLIFPALLVLAAGSAPSRASDNADLSSVLEAQGIHSATSTLLIRRLSDGREWISNAGRVTAAFPPASTSKIPHTLIALETAVARPDTPFQWDGTERIVKSWNRDHTLETAYRHSVVWVYQQIVTSLGTEAMASWISEIDYGNRNTGSRNDLTTYWLLGPLKLSAAAQVDFLTRLVRRELPFSAATYDTGIPLMLSASGEGWELFGKTGWRMDGNNTDIGWFVGWLQRDDEETQDTWVFAFNMYMKEPADARKRIPAVRAALAAIGAF